MTHKKIAFLILFVIYSLYSFSQEDVKTFVLKGDEIAVSALRNIEYTMEDYAYSGVEYELYISLEYTNTDHTDALNMGSSIDITYNLYGEEKIDGQYEPQGIIEDNISINNNSNSVSKQSIKTFEFNSSQIANVPCADIDTEDCNWLKKNDDGSVICEGGTEKVLNIFFVITDVSSNLVSLPSDVVLMVGVRKKGKHELDVASTVDVQWDNTAKELSWEYLPGAKFYDVEWIIADNTETGNLFNDDKIEPFRVTTKKNCFKPSLISPYSAAKVQFRVRPVGDFHHPTLIGRKEATWKETAVYNLSGIQQNRNWTYKANYVEDGKYKGVISYFDGAHRSRQTLTNLSSQDLTIVQENVYNKEGRVAAQIMPVPTQSASLGYKSYFNRDVSNQKFNYLDVENDNPLGGTLTGAEKYYSSNNDISSVNKDYIPYAEGYPYSSVEYLPDNTGRITSAKSPGSAFHGADAKLTQTFYAVPTNSELQRLFGSNVGEAKYYKKQVTIDPNRNCTVSYYDEGDNLIATSMSGNPPDNLMPLNETLETFYIDLSGNTELVDNTMLTEVSIINVDGDKPETPGTIESTPYYFTYDLTSVIYHYRVFENGEEVLKICNDCEYELEIEVRGPDGNLLTDADLTYTPLSSIEMDLYNVENESGSIFKAHFKSYDLNYAYPPGANAYLEDFCNSTSMAYEPLEAPGQLSFSIDAKEVGVYTISKRLKLATDQASETALAFGDYMEAVSGSGNLTVTEDINGDGNIDLEDQIITTHINQIDVENCLTTCEDHCIFEIVTNDPTETCVDSTLNLINCNTEYSYDSTGYYTENCRREQVYDEHGNPIMDDETGKPLTIEVCDTIIIYDYVTTTLCDSVWICNEWEDDPVTFSCDGTDYLLSNYQPYFEAYDINYMASGTYPSDWSDTPEGGLTVLDAFECMINNCVESSACLPDPNIDEFYGPTFNLSCQSLLTQLKLDVTPHELNPDIEGSGHLYSTSSTDFFWTDTKMSNYFGFIYTSDVIPSIYYQITNEAIDPDPSDDVDITIADVMDYIDLNDDNKILEDEFYSYFSNSLNWEDWMADVFVASHPEYCHYLQCTERIDALAYQNVLSEVDNWEQAYDLGYLKPCNLTTSINYEIEYYNTSTSHIDLMYYNDIDNTDGTPDDDDETIEADPSLTGSLFNCVDSKLKNIYSFYESQGGGIVTPQYTNTSIYDFVRDYFSNADMTYDGNGNVTSTSNIGVDGTAMPPEQLSQEKWTLFKGMYSGVVHYCIDQVSPNNPCEYYDSEFANVKNPADNPIARQHLYDMEIYKTNKYTVVEQRVQDAIDQFMTIYPDEYDDLWYNVTPITNIENLLKEYLLSTYGLYNPNAVVPVDVPSGAPGYTEFAHLKSFIEGKLDPMNITQYLTAFSLGTYEYPDISAFELPAYPPSDNEAIVYYFSTASTDLVSHPNQGYIETKIHLQNLNTLGTLQEQIDAGYSPPFLPAFDLKYYINDGGSFVEINTANLGILYGLHPVDIQNINLSSYPNYTEPGIGLYMRDEMDMEVEVFVISDIPQADYTLWNLPLGANHRVALYLPNAFEDPNEIEMDFNEVRNECLQDEIEIAIYEGGQEFDDVESDFASDFISNSLNGCFADPFKETFYYHYNGTEEYNMLYFYDQSGQLTQTVPPEGVEVLALNDGSSSEPGQMATEVLPAHRMQSVYQYASNGQLAISKSPDKEVQTLYLYDYQDRLRYEIYYWITGDENFSLYTKYYRYDELNRIIAIGYNPEAVFKNYTPLAGILGISPSPCPQLDQTLVDMANLGSHFCFGEDYDNLVGDNRTNYYYDSYQTEQTNIMNAFLSKGHQNNQKGRICSILYDETFDNDDGVVPAGDVYLGDDTHRYNHATHFKYDLSGNVVEVLQEFVPKSSPEDCSQTILKSIIYEYDLISGNVNKVYIQKGHPNEQFIYKYIFDEDNRITQVLTSVDDRIWEQDAKYFYYAHGPLARIELGHDKVQAMDYAYTLQGWLKGVNSQTLKNNRDIGKDGLADINNPNAYFAEDAIGYSLDFYAEDYKSKNTQTTALEDRFLATGVDSWNSGAIDVVGAPNSYARMAPLYNGNIAAVTTAIHTATGHVGDFYKTSQVNYYRHDRLNRFRKMYTFEGSDVMETNNWSSDLTTIPGDRYKTTAEYDYNGNIKSINRLDIEGGSYLTASNYDYVTDGGGKLLSNQLESVIVEGNQEVYNYDKVGRLDESENVIIDGISKYVFNDWTYFDKIDKVKHGLTTVENDSDPVMEIVYDGEHNRVQKATDNGTDYYLRDASGNILAVYEQTGVYPNYSTNLKYNILYGSDRLGIRNKGRNLGMGITDVDAVNNITTTLYERERGLKEYELKNHLGNVLTTVSDQKLGNGLNMPFSVSTSFEGSGTELGSYTGSYASDIDQQHVRTGDHSVLLVNNNDFSCVTTLPVMCGNTVKASVYGYIESGTSAIMYVNVLHPETYQNMGVYFTDGTTTAGAWQKLEPLGSSGFTVPDYAGLEYVIISVGLWTTSENNRAPTWFDDYAVEVQINSEASLYMADIQSAHDYYPFGLQMPDRGFSGNNDYRFGFQGQEKDDEIFGSTGTAINYKFRMHDARIGRFFSIDPLAAKYPHNSPYAFSENSVIGFIELEGLEKLEFMKGAQFINTQKFQVYGGEGVAAFVDWAVFSYKTSKGNEVASFLPFYSYNSSESNSTPNVYATMKSFQNVSNSKALEIGLSYIFPEDNNGVNIPWQDFKDTYTNCYGSAFGIYGYMPPESVNTLLNDNYTKVSSPKVGAVGVLGDNRHVVEVTGQNDNGELLYKSNWLMGNEVQGTWAEVQSQMRDYGVLKDYENYLDYEESDFNWYAPNE